MITPRFAVAKYTPDLHRLEPRNIGIVAWGEGGLVAGRFLGELPTGQINPPPIINKDTRDAYEQWITYWRLQMNAKGIRRQTGDFVERESPEFLVALMEKSKPHFRLVDGGHLLDRIKPAAIRDFVDEMFSQLVEMPQAVTARAELAELTEATKRIVEASGISDRKDFHRGLPVPRQVHGVLRNFTVDFALGPTGRPTAVFQRILLSRRQSVDSNAFMFESLQSDKTRPISPENCAVLLDTSHPLDDVAETGLKMFQNWITVVDVNDRWAHKKIEEIASRTGVSPL